MTNARILHLDIETRPALYFIWNPYGTSPLPISMMKEPGGMIMWGAKWHENSRVYQMDARKGEARMFKGIADLIAQADMVVTYNGDSFDLPWINGGVVQHRLDPLPPVASLDLYKTVKRLRYQSSKLAYVAPLLQIGEKVKNAGFELWRGVMDGDRKSWQEMAEYNVGDVQLLESGYERLRPYIKSHPRLAPKVKGEARCPVCGSGDVRFTHTPYRTPSGMKARAVCQRCGRWLTVPLKESPSECGSRPSRTLSRRSGVSASSPSSGSLSTSTRAKRTRRLSTPSRSATRRWA